MSELQNNGIEQGAVNASAPTTAQTAAESTQAQGAYNTAGAYTAPTAAGSYAPQQPYAAPGYIQGTPVFTQYQPAAQAQKTRRVSAPARVIMWICGIAAALTLLFGCAVAWVIGIRAIQNAIASPSQPASSSSENGSGNGQDGNGNGGYGGFGFSDDYGDHEDQLPDYGDYGSILPFFDNDGDDVPTQSSNAGLGIKVIEMQLDFIVEDKYDAGLIIVEINDDSSFKGTEVKENDLIVAMNGTKTSSYDTLKALLGKSQPGDSAEFTIARYENGVAYTYDVTVDLIELSND